jgi:hypothetical protein
MDDIFQFPRIAWPTVSAEACAVLCGEHAADRAPNRPATVVS